jgi:hypothetical protein
MVVFRAFFDESGKDAKDNKAFLMGGFLGRVEEWLDACDAWEKALQESAPELNTSNLVSRDH